MNIQGLYKLFRSASGQLSTTKDATFTTPYGARVVWSDKPSQDYLVTNLAGNLNSAAQVEAYFNEMTSTLDGSPQSRLGAFFGCFAKAKVWQFTKNVSCDFDVALNDRPILDDPWSG